MEKLDLIISMLNKLQVPTVIHSKVDEKLEISSRKEYIPVIENIPLPREGSKINSSGPTKTIPEDIQRKLDNLRRNK